MEITPRLHKRTNWAMPNLGKAWMYTFKPWELRLTIALVFTAGLLVGFIIAAPDTTNGDVTGESACSK